MGFNSGFKGLSSSNPRNSKLVQGKLLFQRYTGRTFKQPPLLSKMAYSNFIEGSKKRNFPSLFVCSGNILESIINSEIQKIGQRRHQNFAFWMLVVFGFESDPPDMKISYKNPDRYNFIVFNDVCYSKWRDFRILFLSFWYIWTIFLKFFFFTTVSSDVVYLVSSKSSIY